MVNQVAQSSHAAHPLLVRTVRNTHRLDSGREYRVGRDDGSDIPLTDARASWDHAVIRAEGPVWVLQDVGSRNGTFLGSRRVTRLEITGSCVVHFGHPEDGPVLSFELAEPPGPPGAPGAPGAPALSRSPASPWFGQPQEAGASAETTFMPGVLRDPTSRVRIQSKVMRIGRRRDNDIVLDDMGVSKVHAELRLLPGGRYQISDLGSHNGTYVNGTRVNQAELSEDDIIAIGNATFRLVGGELIEYVDDGRATFEAHDLRVVVSDGGKPKVLLDAITFPLAERSMMAVIGPAGAGKSTLLNALTGKHQATAGSVTYDFRDLYENYDELKHRIGLVPQQSVTHDQLTAAAALGYAAELRFPPDTGEQERSQRVSEVLADLSMSQHAGTRIERLSGGQRKRVNIGLELLTRPTLLFLDEPTSPLDPHLKRDMFAQMRTMADPGAEKGQSVIVITHDVESKLINQCDRLLVLQPGGKMAYFGPPAEGLRYFGKEDWADVFQAFADEPDRDFAAQYRASPEYVKYVATPISVRQGGAERPRQDDSPLPRRRGLLNQVFTMTRRYRKVMWADRVYMLTTLLMPVLLGVLVRFTPSPTGLANTTVPGPGFNGTAVQMLMILVMSAVLSGTANSIREFIKEREIFERERMAGLSPTAYLLSKMALLSLISVVQMALVTVVGLGGRPAPASGVVIPGPAIIEIWLALAVLALVSTLLGLAVSTLVTKGDQTMPVLVGVTMVQVALCGGIFPLTGGIGIASMIAPARWGLAAIASTIDLNGLQRRAVPTQDLLWTHNAAHWAISMGMMLFIGLCWLVIARVRLAAIGPRKRKEVKAAVPRPVGQPASV